VILTATNYTPRTDSSRSRVARWLFLFLYQKCKNGCILVCLGIEKFGVLHAHLLFLLPFCYIFMASWYFYCQFGTFFPILVCCTKKNLATLTRRRLNLSADPVRSRTSEGGDNNHFSDDLKTLTHVERIKIKLALPELRLQVFMK
jgi:hypothetical protein